MRTAPIGPVEGDARDHERSGRGVDRQDVMRVHLVGTEDRPDDVDFVAEALGEARAQGSVDEAGGQRRRSPARPSRRKNEPGILPAA